MQTQWRRLGLFVIAVAGLHRSAAHIMGKQSGFINLGGRRRSKAPLMTGWRKAQGHSMARADILVINPVSNPAVTQALCRRRTRALPTSRPPTGADMTARTPENVSPLVGNTMPPRDPNEDDDDAEDEDGDAEPDVSADEFR
jgi:hypothetical protein